METTTNQAVENSNQSDDAVEQRQTGGMSIYISANGYLTVSSGNDLFDKNENIQVCSVANGTEADSLISEVTKTLYGHGQVYQQYALNNFIEGNEHTLDNVKQTLELILAALRSDDSEAIAQAVEAANAPDDNLGRPPGTFRGR